MPRTSGDIGTAGFRLCFFAESQVGIGSMGRSLRPFAEAQPGVRLTWVDVTYQNSGGLLERAPLPGRGVVRGFLQVGEGLRKGPHDALLFLTHNPAVFRPGALLRTPTCLWTDVTPAQLDRQAALYDHPVDRFRVVRALKRAAVAHTFRLARRCLAWSEWARRSLIEDYGVPSARTAVVPPGVNLERWKMAARGDPRGPLRLLFVGGDFRRKGGPLLLELLRTRLRGRCELDIVTREEVANEEGVRVHRGLSPQDAPLMALYRAADAFVLPTLADCHSVASLEAMATGLPVVLTRVGANEEIVEHRESGFLIKPGDGRELADALEALVRDPRTARQMGARGRALVEKRFDAARTTALLFAHARGEEPAA
jgi:glycosyltransferase involved in cell wall biosynthesis